MLLLSLRSSPALRQEPILAPPGELGARIGAQYRHALLRQVYKLVLNVDTLSQPANLVRNLGLGVKDFIFHPFRTREKSPLDVGKDVVFGSIGLARATVSGTRAILAAALPAERLAH